MAAGKGRDERRETRWRRIVRQQAHNGLSTREFRRRSKLRETAFYFWRGELQRRQAEQERRHGTESPVAPAFVAVRVEEPNFCTSDSPSFVMLGPCVGSIGHAILRSTPRGGGIGSLANSSAWAAC